VSAIALLPKVVAVVFESTHSIHFAFDARRDVTLSTLPDVVEDTREKVVGRVQRKERLTVPEVIIPLEVFEWGVMRPALCRTMDQLSVRVE
jgi:hypothetical protein